VCVCVCVFLPYPACNGHEPYYHLWSDPLYITFSAFSHKWHDFRKKKIFEQKCVFSFSLQFLSETVLNLRRTERDMIIKAY